MNDRNDNLLGAFLKERRERLDAAALGLGSAPQNRRGLLPEEVAQRANVSAAWYSWLEEGRGGKPSPDLLERIAFALALSPADRDHLFLLAQRRPPEVADPAGGIPAPGAVTPQLQAVLDALPISPAYLRNSAWNVVAWNRAAEAVLGGTAALTPQGEAARAIEHAEAGRIVLDTSTFIVEGHAGLVMVIRTPATREDAHRVRALLVTRHISASSAADPGEAAQAGARQRT